MFADLVQKIEQRSCPSTLLVLFHASLICRSELIFSVSECRPPPPSFLLRVSSPRWREQQRLISYFSVERFFLCSFQWVQRRKDSICARCSSLNEIADQLTRRTNVLRNNIISMIIITPPAQLPHIEARNAYREREREMGEIVCTLSDMYRSSSHSIEAHVLALSFIINLIKNAWELIYMYVSNTRGANDETHNGHVQSKCMEEKSVQRRCRLYQESLSVDLSRQRGTWRNANSCIDQTVWIWRPLNNNGSLAHVWTNEEAENLEVLINHADHQWERKWSNEPDSITHGLL